MFTVKDPKNVPQENLNQNRVVLSLKEDTQEKNQKTTKLLIKS